MRDIRHPRLRHPQRRTAYLLILAISAAVAAASGGLTVLLARGG
jgi:hypothetical protein